MIFAVRDVETRAQMITAFEYHIVDGDDTRVGQAITLAGDSLNFVLDMTAAELGRQPAPAPSPETTTQLLFLPPADVCETPAGSTDCAAIGEVCCVGAGEVR
jgi:hypothetical protein